MPIGNKKTKRPSHPTISFCHCFRVSTYSCWSRPCDEYWQWCCFFPGREQCAKACAPLWKMNAHLNCHLTRGSAGGTTAGASSTALTSTVLESNPPTTMQLSDSGMWNRWVLEVLLERTILLRIGADILKQLGRYLKQTFVQAVALCICFLNISSHEFWRFLKNSECATKDNLGRLAVFFHTRTLDSQDSCHEPRQQHQPTMSWVDFT